MSTRYDKRIDQLEEKMTAEGQLPKNAKGPYIQWNNDDFSDIEAKLIKTYGTANGAQFLSIRWGESKTNGDQTEKELE